MSHFASGGCIGHRGCRDLRSDLPQNTLSAFRTVLQHYPSVRAVELDVRLSRDAQLVVFHDAHLSPLTDAPEGLRVADAPLAALQKFAYRGCTAPHSAQTCIPTLRQVLDALWGSGGRERPVPVMLEIKDPQGLLVLEAVLRLLRDYPGQQEGGFCAFHHVWVASFNPVVVYEARRREPRVLTCLLVFGSPLGQLFQTGDASREEDDTTPHVAGQLAPPGTAISGGPYRVEAEAVDQAQRELSQKWYGRILASPLTIRLVDGLWNGLLTSSLLRRFLGYSFLATTPDLATPLRIQSLRDQNVQMLVWTINDPRLKDNLQSKGALVITDNSFY